MGGETSTCGSVCAGKCKVQSIPSDKAAAITPDTSRHQVEEVDIAEDEDARRLAAMRGKKKREGVTCESVSETAVKDYVKPVYQKDSASGARIKDILKTDVKLQVLFGHLPATAIEDVVNAFQDRQVLQSEDLIRQGDEGDCLYIINEGQVDVFVNRPSADGPAVSGKGPKVVTLGGGALFGELALMYQAPRAATVTVASPTCKLWKLDREPFKMLLAQTASNTYQKYEGWLGEVDILKSLNHFELAKLSEMMESDCFDGGDIIVTQGEAGDKFYILEDGTCAAYIAGADGEKEVKAYVTGEYFGEIALLKNEPRKATVRATGEGAVVASLSKEDFTNMLGPIQDILAKQIDKYPQYAALLR